jgi:predicted RNA-binding protein with PUA-like domain
VIVVAHFLFKTEPGDYAYADLVREKRTVWQGVKNPLALKYLGTAKVGDTIAFYHTGSEKSVVGVARVVAAPYPDPDLDDPRRLVVDLAPVRPLGRPIAISEFRADPILSGTELVRLPRLSVMPLTEKQFAQIEKLAGA